MNEKLNIQDFIDLLAEKHGMSKKNADSFVKEFFQLIEEALEKDKYVKIKGLGAFKLIDVESRESVNVNTGERFEIQGYTKVSFTPEPSLRDAINKPFSHFETVVLNDNTVLEDTPVADDSEDEEASEKAETGEDIVDAEAPADTEIEPAASAEEVPEPVEKEEEAVEVVEKSEPQKEVSALSEEEEVPVEEPLPVPDEETLEKIDEELKKAEEIEEVSDKIETEELSEETEAGEASEKVEIGEVPAKAEVEKASEEVSVAMAAEAETKTEPEPVVGQPAEKKEADSSTMKYFIGIVAFVVVLCFGAVVYLYYPDMFTSEPPMEKIADAKADTPALADSISAKDTTQSAKADTIAETLAATSKPKETPGNAQVAKSETTKEQKKPTVAEPFKADSVGYTIVGTEATYTIKEGETLTRVALRFYGTKALWPYIVKHNPNVIKNPDNVPYGTTIKIPKLVKKQ
ncbi:MAG: HU family DNA-binding protein [Bacteroides sp.]|nr:HU family DNA-binding protein [Bacteroides sp.]